MVITLLVVAGSGSLAGIAAPAPSCSTPPYRAFDFWLGEWQVTTADARLAGRNEITSEQSGCLLVERWRSVEGGTGMSMNYYDVTLDAWRQVWVSPGVVIDISGGPVKGRMVLEGTIAYAEGARSARFRGTWTPLEDGRVRQFFEEADADGAWRPWFEGFYRRLEDAAND